jgi:tRNA pseudouridine55 synthase
VLLIGRSTRLSRYVTGLDKAYTATARFGAVSDTLDADGEITHFGAPMPDEDAIRAALPDLTGDLLQVPPMASALKREGVRLYDLHRRGVTVEREPRPVTVHVLELLATEREKDTATFEISCTSGTYVRTLITDLAERLGTGAYLTALRRTRVGHLPVERAATPDAITPITIHNHIIQPVEVVAHLPRVDGKGSGRSGAGGRSLRRGWAASGWSITERYSGCTGTLPGRRGRRSCYARGSRRSGELRRGAPGAPGGGAAGR